MSRLELTGPKATLISGTARRSTSLGVRVRVRVRFGVKGSVEEGVGVGARGLWRRSTS